MCWPEERLFISSLYTNKFMSLLMVAIGIVVLLLLLLVVKLNAFFSLLLVSFLVALLEGMSLPQSLQSITTGVGSTLGSITLIMVFGAMLGKLLEESGAAQRITFGLIGVVGRKNIQWAVLITGFLIGFPMIYNAGFLVLIPLIFSLAKAARVPLLFLGIPMAASLSTAHGLLPPHPAPTAIAALFNADVNTTLLFGFFIAVPTVVLAGPVLSRFFTGWHTEPRTDLFSERAFLPEELPGLGSSIFIALIPVLLMLLAGVVTTYGAAENSLVAALRFAGDPTIALLLAVLAGLYFLGIRKGKKMETLMQSLSASVGAIAMILLIIAAGGAFKQVLLDSGVGEEIKNATAGINISPLLLAWTIAALLRLALGSATVAAITAAGIVQPLLASCCVRPELMVLATTAGSLMFSHVNDVGFWMFKEYFNVSIKQTFAIWTVMESIVAIMGLIGVLVIQALS